jgi:glycosyltransferase involved in cell wall biosynthesis
MKVLFINTFDISGGAERICYELLLHEQDAAMLVKNKFSGNPRVQPFPVFTMDKLFFSLDALLFRFGVKNRLKSKLFIAEEYNQTYRKLSASRAYREADVIHLHNIHGGYFDLDAVEKIAAEKPVVWTLHDMWAITGGESYTFENENYKKGIGKTPYSAVQPLNNPLIDRRQHFLERKKEIYATTAGHITFVPVSKWMENCLRESYVFNPGIRITQIDNGYDDTVFYNQHIRSGEKPGLLFFNSTQSYKGSSVFTAIAAEVAPIATITCIGAPLNVPGVLNVPYIKDQTELADTYNRNDILILPSLAESFSLVALEAMACGMCVVASDVGALPERISPEWGYLFETGNSEDLKRKLSMAVSSLKKTRLMGEMAAEQAKKFTFDLMIERYHRLYSTFVQP